MPQDIFKDALQVFATMQGNQKRLGNAVAARIEFDDPAAQALLDRHCGPYLRRWEGGGVTDDLMPLLIAYHLSHDHLGGLAHARSWWALQHAAFVVQKDLLALATYAKRLEEENRHLRQAQTA